jgi:hypothetical protein
MAASGAAQKAVRIRPASNITMILIIVDVGRGKRHGSFMQPLGITKKGVYR